MTTPSAAGTAIRPGVLTAVVCLALATVVAAMSSLNVALPDIARSTQASQTQLSWIIDSYALVFAALLLPAGAIGDRYGRRRALLIGLALFGLGSALAMTADSATELIALRALLGVGAALVMPATLSTITSTFSAADRTRAVGVWAGVAGGSAVLGLLCSGLLLEAWSWQSVFGLNVALATVAGLATWRLVPESADPEAPALDVGGAIISILGLVALVYSIIEAPEHGWTSARTIGGIALGLVILAGFVVHELRHPTPMLDPRVFTHRALAAGSLSIFVQFFAFFGFIFVILQYLQLVRGDSALVSALSMLPMAACMIPAARLSPKIVEHAGARRVCVAGLILMAAGFVVLAQLGAGSSYWAVLGGLLPLGLGMGAAMTPATSAITSALPSAQQGVASAINDLARELGGALGIAVIGSVLSSGYRSNLDLSGSGVPEQAADAARESLAGALHVGGPLAQQAHLAFLDGLQSAFLVAAVAVVLAAIAVGRLIPSPAARHTASDLVHDDAAAQSST
jgi:EmrB/QacA subfamily drug resistance transporter